MAEYSLSNIEIDSFFPYSYFAKIRSVEIGTCQEDLKLPKRLAALAFPSESNCNPAEKGSFLPCMIEIDGIVWKSDDPYLDGMVEGQYIFTAVLPENYYISDESALPQITIAVKKGADVSDTGKQSGSVSNIKNVIMVNSVTMNQYGFETGTNYLGHQYLLRNAQPFEMIIPFYIEADQMPAKNACIAISNRGFGSSQYGPNSAEPTMVYLNDDDCSLEQTAYIGSINSGKNFCSPYEMSTKKDYGVIYNITDEYIPDINFLELPLHRLRVGYNTLHINGYQAAFGEYGINYTDWIQILLDFDYPLNEGLYKTVNKKKTLCIACSPFDAYLEYMNNERFVTYGLLVSESDEPGSGQKLGSIFSSGYFQGVLPFYLDKQFYQNKDTDYRMLLQCCVLDSQNQQIVSVYRLHIGYDAKTQKTYVPPQCSHVLTPASGTKDAVKIEVSAESFIDSDKKAYCKKIEFEKGSSLTVAQNGRYEFKINYSDENNIKRQYTYAVVVSNIDTEKPVLNKYTMPFPLMAGSSKKCIETYLNYSFKVYDDTGIKQWPCVKILNQNPDNGALVCNVQVEDNVGNLSEITTEIPMEMSEAHNSMEQLKAKQTDVGRYIFTAKIKNPWVYGIKKTGFIWGIVQSPTIKIYNGIVHAEMKQIEECVELTSPEIAVNPALTYYLRAYYVGIDNGEYIYSKSEVVLSSVAEHRFGHFSISYLGDNVFIIKRDGELDTKQCVHIRTIDGSAIQEIDFKPVNTDVIFEPGMEAAEIKIVEYKRKDRFSGTSLTYRLNIDYVEGGATIGEASATGEISNYIKVSKDIFEMPCIINGPLEEITRGDYDSDKLGFKLHKEYPTAKEVVNLEKLVYPELRGYLKYKKIIYYYQLVFDACEINSGYQCIQINTGERLDLNIAVQSGMIVEDKDAVKTASYMISFEHSGSTQNSSYKTYTVPPDNSPYVFGEDRNLLADWITYTYSAHSSCLGRLPLKDKDKYLYSARSICIGYTASGNGNDKWKTKNVQHKIWLVHYGCLSCWRPNRSRGYRLGELFTIPIVFSSIIDKRNSPNIESVRLYTDWGYFYYAGGVDTCVLYFVGRSISRRPLIHVNSIENSELLVGMNGVTEESIYVKHDIYLEAVDAVIKIDLSWVTLEKNSAIAKCMIEVDGNYTAMYQWSDTDILPENDNWLPVKEEITGDSLFGMYYLHVTVVCQKAGYSVWKKISNLFAERSLKVNADNSSWAKERVITVSYYPDNGTVTYSGPEYGVVNGNSVVVQHNGTYVFELVYAQDTAPLVQQIRIIKIDNTPPILDIQEPAEGKNAAGWYGRTPIELGIAAIDNESGVKNVIIKEGENGAEGVVAADWSSTQKCKVSIHNDGDYVLYSRAEDRVDNSSEWILLALKIDTVIPMLKVVQTEAEGTEFMVSCENSPISGVIYEVSHGGTWKEAKITNGYYTAQSKGTYQFRAVTGSGNSKTSQSFIVDKAKPAVPENLHWLLSPNPEAEYKNPENVLLLWDWLDDVRAQVTYYFINKYGQRIAQNEIWVENQEVLDCCSLLKNELYKGKEVYFDVRFIDGELLSDPAQAKAWLSDWDSEPEINVNLESSYLMGPPYYSYKGVNYRVMLKKNQEVLRTLDEVYAPVVPAILRTYDFYSYGEGTGSYMLSVEPFFMNESPLGTKLCISLQEPQTSSFTAVDYWQNPHWNGYCAAWDMPENKSGLLIVYKDEIRITIIPDMAGGRKTDKGAVVCPDPVFDLSYVIQGFGTGIYKFCVQDYYSSEKKMVPSWIEPVFSGAISPIPPVTNVRWSHDTENEKRAIASWDTLSDYVDFYVAIYCDGVQMIPNIPELPAGVSIMDDVIITRKNRIDLGEILSAGCCTFTVSVYDDFNEKRLLFYGESDGLTVLERTAAAAWAEVLTAKWDAVYNADYYLLYLRCADQPMKIPASLIGAKTEILDQSQGIIKVFDITKVDLFGAFTEASGECRYGVLPGSNQVDRYVPVYYPPTWSPDIPCNIRLTAPENLHWNDEAEVENGRRGIVYWENIKYAQFYVVLLRKNGIQAIITRNMLPDGTELLNGGIKVYAGSAPLDFMKQFSEDTAGAGYTFAVTAYAEGCYPSEESKESSELIALARPAGLRWIGDGYTVSWEPVSHAKDYIMQLFDQNNNPVMMETSRIENVKTIDSEKGILKITDLTSFDVSVLLEVEAMMNPMYFTLLAYNSNKGYITPQYEPAKSSLNFE